MNKYIKLFNNYLSTSLEYRGNLVGIIVQELIIAFGVLVLWISVYKSETNLAGYDFSRMLLYYFTVPLIGFFTYSNISSELGDEIKSGFFSTYILKPHSIWKLVLSRSLANKISNLSLVIPVYILVFVFLHLTFNVNFSFSSILVGLCIAILAFIMHFFLDYLVAMLSFFMDDVWWFSHAKVILFSLFGGVAFPFDLIPIGVRPIFEMLPFKYLYFVPVTYFLGKRDVKGYLFNDLIGIGLWIVGFIIIGFWLNKKGIKRYGAFGN